MRQEQIERIKLNLWLENSRLKQQLKEARSLADHLHKMLDECRIGIRPYKQFSSQYIVLTEKDGKYTNPVIVEADCAEEALMPEGERFVGNVCLPIPAREEFKEI